jgi:hypothetical protein
LVLNIGSFSQAFGISLAGAAAAPVSSTPYNSFTDNPALLPFSLKNSL